MKADAQLFGEGAAPGWGDHLDAAPCSAWPGRGVIAKPLILLAGGQRNVLRGLLLLKAEPEKLNNPCRHIEGGPGVASGGTLCAGCDIRHGVR
jgi:hypothetical protein